MQESEQVRACRPSLKRTFTNRLLLWHSETGLSNFSVCTTALPWKDDVANFCCKLDLRKHETTHAMHLYRKEGASAAASWNSQGFAQWTPRNCSLVQRHKANEREYLLHF